MNLCSPGAAARRIIMSLAAVGALLMVLLLVAGCGGQSPSATTLSNAISSGSNTTTAKSGVVTVVMKNLTFSPAKVTIKVGETVTWVNQDSSVQHDAVANNGEFKSKLLSQGQTFSFTFAKAGTYSYYCSIHPFMVGIVTVK
jgi:plastocyanin